MNWFLQLDQGMQFILIVAAVIVICKIVDALTPKTKK